MFSNIRYRNLYRGGLDMLIKDKTVLQIISDKHSNYYEISEKADKNGNLAYNNWWYFHGELEEYFGYDKGSVINAKELLKSGHCVLVPKWDMLKWDIDRECRIFYTEEKELKFCPQLMFDGIVKCNILDLSTPCIGFFWVAEKYPMKIINPKTKEVKPEQYCYGKQMGLICFENDKNAIKYAWECFRKKDEII